MDIDIRPMTADDSDEVVALWRATEGIGLSGADEPGPLRRYLERNASLSLVARENERVVGALLCGHDGRRGYLHHLAVHPSVRRLGLGRRLVARGLAALSGEGITRCHLFVFRENLPAARFWQSAGWRERADLRVFSVDLPDPATRDGAADGAGPTG